MINAQPPVSLQGLPATKPDQIVVFFVASISALGAISPGERIFIYTGTIRLSEAVKLAPEDVRARLAEVRATAELLLRNGGIHIGQSRVIILGYSFIEYWVIGTSEHGVL